jgi:hypothetical protein
MLPLVSVYMVFESVTGYILACLVLAGVGVLRQFLVQTQLRVAGSQTIAEAVLYGAHTTIGYLYVIMLVMLAIFSHDFGTKTCYNADAASYLRRHA